MFELEKYRDNIAFIDELGRKVYYEEILGLTKRITSKIGIRKHIYMKASTNLGMILYYVAFLHTGNVVQVVDQELSVEQHQNYIKKYRPEYICEEVDAGVEYFDQLYGYGIRREAEADKKEINSELALLLPTSGSTGDCKFVRQSKRNMISNAKSIIEYLQIAEGDRAILSLPLSYTFGLSVLHTHIMSGATLLVPYSKIYQPAFWDFFQKYHGITFSGVPYTFELLDKLNFFSRKLHLRYITQAGGKLPIRLQNRISDFVKENELRFYIMYGQTEATARMTYLPPEYFASNQKGGSVGFPIPGGKIEIHHADEQEKGASPAEGEIVYQGDNVCLGYADDYRDLCRGDDNHGILRTGDMGYLDQDGFLYITGRKKRFVKILGKRMNLDDIESKIKERFCLSCAVVGNDNKICICVDSGQTDEIRNYAIKMFHVHAQNIQVRYLKEIPRLQSGKCNYTELLKRKCE